MRVCKGKAIAFFVLSLVFLPLSAFAQGVLPPHIASRIDDAVREVHGLIQRDAALAGTLADWQLAAVVAQRSHHRAASTISAFVVGAIAENPPLAAEIVATAVAATPQFRDRIINDAARSFPDFARIIIAAGGIIGLPQAAAATPAPTREIEGAGVGMAPRFGAPRRVTAIRGAQNNTRG